MKSAAQTVFPCSGSIDDRAGNRAEYDRADVARHGAAAALLRVMARRSTVVDNEVVTGPDMASVRDQASYLARYYGATMTNVRVSIYPIDLAGNAGRFTPADAKAAAPSEVITSEQAAAAKATEASTTAPATPSVFEDEHDLHAALERAKKDLDATLADGRDRYNAASSAFAAAVDRRIAGPDSETEQLRAAEHAAHDELQRVDKARKADDAAAYARFNAASSAFAAAVDRRIAAQEEAAQA